MVINADEDKHQGAFTAEEVLSNTMDRKHPRRFAFGKDILRWHLRNVRYLEWGTTRALKQFRRPTFPQLHDTKEKLVAVRTPGSVPKLIYDDDHLHFDASSVGFVPWHHLKGVRNKSIKKTAKYRNEVKSGQKQPAIYREVFEKLSKQFDLKFLLGIMNSEYAKNWLSKRRRSKFHIYPDDWKLLPIPAARMTEQAPIAALVNKILALYAKHGHPLPDEQAKRLAALEQEIEEHVAKLYGQ